MSLVTFKLFNIKEAEDTFVIAVPDVDEPQLFEEKVDDCVQIIPSVEYTATFVACPTAINFPLTKDMLVHVSINGNVFATQVIPSVEYAAVVVPPSAIKIPFPYEIDFQ